VCKHCESVLTIGKVNNVNSIIIKPTAYLKGKSGGDSSMLLKESEDLNVYGPEVLRG